MGSQVGSGFGKRIPVLWSVTKAVRLPALIVEAYLYNS